MTPSLPAELERRLLAAATGLAGARRVPEVVTRLRPALECLPGTAVSGLCLHDEERRLRLFHVLTAGRAESERLEIPAPEDEGPGEARPGPDRRAAVLARAEAGHPSSFPGELAARGIESLVRAPLFFDERVLGTLFVGRRAGDTLPEEALAYLAELTKVVEPHVWNAFTDERFSRGDRRRDALRELSRVINTSLDPGVVLHLARTAIGSIEGHRFSWIGLLEPDGTRWRRHDRPREYRETPGEEPAPRPLAESVLERVLAQGTTWESGDLARARLFRDDDELLAHGVRRYVVTPLAAGGRTLGAFLFGSDDPHPALRVDVWLIENVALQIALALDNALHYEEVRRLSARREQQNAYLREEIRSEHDAEHMLGRSPAMDLVRDRIARVAATEATVLISGPTGVGKELVARAIHEASPRREQPMVKLNCAAIPEGMVESELFGHERGAFTSAVDRRIGRFELAHHGTLFLDEVGELPLAVQAKLLRVLQSGEFERVGGSRTLTSNARILAATNRELARAMEAGRFRSDLFYRLNVFPIDVPPLAERREDIPLLARAFVESFARRMGKRFTSIAPRGLESLCARDWPGNVRELKHVIERAVILCDGPLLAIEEETPAPRSVAGEPRPTSGGLATLEEIEEAHIRSALRRSGGVIEGPRGAAAILGLKGSTLRFRMKRHGIQRPRGE